MTDDETKIISLLSEATLRFARLKQESAVDIEEFGAAVHAAQNIVLAREGMRSLKAEAYVPPEWVNPTNLH